MTEDREVELLRRLDALRKNHNMIDKKIFAITKQSPDQFSLFRLKREKLALRDEIAKLERIVYPDIIA